MTDKEEFISLISGVERNGIPELLQWLETTDFYTCPASARYHGSYSGGLLRHFQKATIKLGIIGQHNDRSEVLCFINFRRVEEAKSVELAVFMRFGTTLEP